VTFLVGSQGSDHIQQLFADFNSMARTNALIAPIDSEIFEAKVVDLQLGRDEGQETMKGAAEGCV